jgi:hypothetical protein
MLMEWNKNCENFDENFGKIFTQNIFHVGNVVKYSVIDNIQF